MFFIQKRVPKDENVKLVIEEGNKELFHTKFINEIIGTRYCYFTNKYKTAIKPLMVLRAINHLKLKTFFKQFSLENVLNVISISNRHLIDTC